MYFCRLVFLSICLPVCLCISAGLSFCLSVCLPVCLCSSAGLSFCLSVCLPACLCISAGSSFCLSVCLSVCVFLPARLSVCLSVSLSVCLPVCPCLSVDFCIKTSPATICTHHLPPRIAIYKRTLDKPNCTVTVVQMSEKLLVILSTSKRNRIYRYGSTHKKGLRHFLMTCKWPTTDPWMTRKWPVNDP